MDITCPPRLPQRVRHEKKHREVHVARVARLGTRFVSVTFSGESLHDFRSDGFDDHVKFMFVGDSGEPIRRDYTPRHFDPSRGELTIEFLLHGQGEASEWAQRAAPGMPATIGGPKSSFIIPTDYSWHLLAGDSTALPAIHRRLEQLPADTRAIVLVQTADMSERRELSSAAALDVSWLSPSDDLAAAVQELSLPDSEGFAWCAGESTVMARLRETLLVDKQHPPESMRVAAYWTQHSSD